MRIQVAGRHVSVGEALQTRITTELEATLNKYSARPSDAVVTIGREGVDFTCDCTLHLDSGIVLQAQGAGPDAHMAFEAALTRVEKRVRRYRKRLKNHHKNGVPLPAEASAYYVLAGGNPDEDVEDHEDSAEQNGPAAPLVIAETTKPLKTMPVAMAVLQLELSEDPALMFRNAASGNLNLVYRRRDGNIGWVDPGAAPAA